MTMSSSVVPQKFCGLRVLLVESDRMSLQIHANLLNQNSYRVAITTEPSKGLSMIMDGHTYDCVLIDADICKTDMDAFLHQVLKHGPQMSIILMASEDIYLRIHREALESEAVHCLLKPCSLTDICNIWKHISRNRSSFEENVSMEKLHTIDQVDNNVMRDDPRVKPSAINGSTVINNNVSLGNFTEQVTNGELFPNDDNVDADDQENVHKITPKENMGTCTMKKVDKRKQPLILKRKNDQPVEDDKLSKKRKEFKTRISWKGELEEKFINALRELGATAQSRTILQHMNVPGLTRHHVASHLQKYHKRRKLIEACMGESFANERWKSTQSNGSASNGQSSSLLKLPTLNLAGILYVVIKKIMARLQEARPLPVPHPTTTPSNNYCGDQATDHSLRVVESSNSGGQGTEIQQAMEPQVTCKISSQYPFGDAMAPLGVENSNSGGQGTEIQQIGHDYENAMEPQVTSELSSHHPIGEAMAPLGVKNSNSGGQGNDIQLRRHVHENAMEPQVPGELSSHHPFGEAMAPLGVENFNSGCQGNEIQLRGQVHENAMEPQVPGELSSHHPFGEAMAPLGVENSNSGGQGNEIQLRGQVHENAMEPQVPGELSLHHPFGEAIAPLGVENSNNVGQGTEVQLKGHGYGNAMEPQVTSELASCHAFGEAVAPLGVESFNNGGQGTEIQLISQDYGMELQLTSDITSYHAFGEATALFGVENSNNGGQRTEYQLISQDYENAMEPQVTSEISSYHAFREAVAPLGVENSNNGGQGTEYQLIGHDYGNAMEPQVRSEISSYHAFGEAVTPSGVENSNNGGQGTEYQLIGQNYGNAMEPQVTSEISSHHAFGEATEPLSVEGYNYDGQGIDVQLIGNDYENAMEPQVTAEASSHHACGEAMSPLGVGASAASDNILGMDVNSLHSILNNTNFGDASGSGLGEVQVQVSCSGPATDPWVADCEGNDSLEGLDWPDFFSFDSEGRLCASQEAHVNRENLGLVSPRSATHLNVENQINPGSNPDSIPIQPASADFSFPEFPNEDDDSLAQTQLPVNPGVPLDGSQARFIDNGLSQSDLENAMSLFDDDDSYLFGGPFYF